MKKVIYLHLILFMTLVSCDPPHSLSFVNKTNGNARVIIKLNDKIIKNENLTNYANSDSICFDLKKYQDSTFSFGLGNWTDTEIMSISNDIKSIKIKTKNVELNYIDRIPIYYLFKSSLGKFSSSKINIEIKNKAL